MGRKFCFFPARSLSIFLLLPLLFAFLIIKYAPNMQYVDVVSVLVCGFFKV